MSVSKNEPTSCATVAVKTLGCKVNRVESETILDQLSAHCLLTNEPANADIVVLNTCTVTREADAKSRKEVRRLCKHTRVKHVIVTGCAAALHEKVLTELSRKVIVLADKTAVLNRIEQIISAGSEWCDCAPVEHDHSEDNAAQSQTTTSDELYRTRRFVKIQDGCENFCSYCIVPYARGPRKSTPLPAILEHVQTLVANGALEIVLTGIDLGAWSYDDGTQLWHLPQLIDALATTGLHRLRLSSIEPVHVSAELLESCERNRSLFCPHLHIPLQAGSDEVLTAMKRPYSVQEFKQMVARVREHFPHIALTTDVIVGYPTETEQDFERTLALCREIGFAKIHVFRYSPRAGTPAAELKPLDPCVLADRGARLRALSDELAQDYRASFIGETVEALLEHMTDDGFVGTTREHLTVKLSKTELCSDDQNLTLGSCKHIVLR